MKLVYTAFDKAGKQVSDALEAASLAEAGEILRRQGLFVTELREAAAAAQGATARVIGGGRGSLRDVSSFMRQLSVLISTGTPMVEALGSLEKQLKPGQFRSVIADVRERVEEGAQFSDALAAHPRLFDPVCRSLVAAGESGGQLDAMLRRLASLLRQQLKVRSTVLGAMVYPCVLIVVSIIVLVAMVGFVMPRFESLFTTLGAELPASTRLMMDVGGFVRGNWYFLLGGLVAAGVGTKLWLSSRAGRLWLDGVMVWLPQIGKVVRALATARITRVLGVLIEGKVPLMEALHLARESTGNSRYAALVDRAVEAVTRGEPVSTAFFGTPLVAESVAEAIRSGERTGQLGPVLSNLSDFMDEDNELIVKSIASIIEPIILMVLGVLVGFVALSMFLPLFDLTSMAGGGG
ncbi:MAG: type II secretion system F family protein [Phycisphaeraceae bacterium]|nr:type II secretion system F family protein [Phycisphaeraceae bacterium]